MKGICVLLSAWMIMAGFFGVMKTSGNDTERMDELKITVLYVGDFSDIMIPENADTFCRIGMKVDEVLSLRMDIAENHSLTLAERLSQMEYNTIYLSLRLDDAAMLETYWQVLNLVTWTQPQASIYIFGQPDEDCLQELANGRNVYYFSLH